MEYFYTITIEDGKGHCSTTSGLMTAQNATMFEVFNGIFEEAKKNSKINSELFIVTNFFFCENILDK